MPCRSYFLTPTGAVERDLSESAMRDALNEPDATIWLDFDGLTTDDAEMLERVFGLHPLALDACLDPEPQQPKVEDYGGSVFIIARGIDYAAEARTLATAEMDIFIGANFVVSNHDRLLYNVEAVAAMVERDGRPLDRGAPFIAYMLLDALVNHIWPSLQGLSELADAIEAAVIEKPDTEALGAILELKQAILQLRREVAPQREALRQLGRAELAHVTGDARLYFRDIYDSILSVENYVVELRDRVDTSFSVYLSMVANQQNESMRVLAVVATVFMPLSLIAGIYGMNFAHIPELSWQWGYFAVLGVMGVAIGGVLWTFWARRWISLGRRRLFAFAPRIIGTERLLSYVAKLDPRRFEHRLIDPRRVHIIRRRTARQDERSSGTR